MASDSTSNVAPLAMAHALDACRATEAAAVAAARWIGRGDQTAADQAAVDAMRASLNAMPVSGRVVIGEGERDQAPMLYIGESVGRGGPRVDVALDPLEGTALTATAAPGALAVLALAPVDGFLHAPDVYMDKIAVGPGLPDGVVDLDAEPAENLAAVARARGVDVRDVGVCILDRPRHADLIRAARAAGARVILIPDGDVAAVIAAATPRSGVDVYMGSGGAPEGVLAAAALRCIGGQMRARLIFRNADERARAAKWGITDLERLYGLTDLASSDVIFVATGVTDGPMLHGVRRRDGQITVNSMIMSSPDHSLRYIKRTFLRPPGLRPPGDAGGRRA